MNIYTRSIGAPMVPAGPYILLVDDEEETIEPLTELVRYAGFTSVAAKSVADAVVCCFHRRPALLVTDLVMPGHDGRALAKRVKRRHPSVPMLLVTGQDLDQPAWRVPPDLFQGVFAKPLDFDRFLKAVERLMPPPAPKARPRARP